MKFLTRPRFHCRIFHDVVNILSGVQCIYHLNYYVNKIAPCERLSNFLVEVPLEVHSSNLCVLSADDDRLINKCLVECI